MIVQQVAQISSIAVVTFGGTLVNLDSVQIQNGVFSNLSPPRLVLEIDIGELLAVVVAHDKAGFLFFARPGRRAGSGGLAACDDYRLALALIRGACIGHLTSVRLSASQQAYGANRETSAASHQRLFLFAQTATMHAQETVDVAKITCQQILKEELASPTHDIVLWLSGYYNGKRNSTIINLRTINNDEEKVRLYCYKNPETTVLDAIKNVLGLGK